MKKITTLLTLGLALAAASCSSKTVTLGKDGEYEGLSSEHLRPTAQSREQALTRSKQVGKVSYQLWFKLEDDNGSNPDFEGRTSIQFDLKPKAKDAGSRLAIDFEEGKVKSIVLNGKTLEDVADAKRYDGHRIWLDLGDLIAGTNRVEIAYTHSYSRNGNGLHRFKDPADGKTYIYSHFEPYNAHRMFPCFDQPDLKATYTLTAEVPPSWVVISNALEKETVAVDGRKSWQFPVTKLFSTYLVALHAGPYVSWKSEAEGMPIRLFARKSMAQYVDHAEWLDVTRRGMTFFNQEYGYEYPFSKYDQIIVPDFNAGAMENVGAVTFSERYIFRSKVTQDRKRGRADTILHELAHQWFGNLTTMKWWNGLWLNESFATYMSARAIDKSTNFKDIWQEFFGTKTWAYWEDQLVTTHPIEVPVGDTDVADSIFDGISYGKGGAVIKQLNFKLGEDQFQDGVQRYFMKYAFKNATTPDFIRMLAEASDQDLTKWQYSWLQKAGVNTVRAEWKCAISSVDTTPGAPTAAKKPANEITEFKLVQTATPEYPELRDHKTLVGMLWPSGKAPKHRLIENGVLKLPVDYSGPVTEVRELIGKPCPEFVFPNLDDHDYAKVELDPVSLELAEKKLSTLKDPLLRSMLWYTLWEMVVDGKYPAQKLADTILAHVGSETNTELLTSVLGYYHRSEVTRPSLTRYMSGDLRKAYLARFEDFAAKGVARSPAGSDVQLIWYLTYLRAAHTPKAVARLNAILSGKEKISGIKIDQDRRWELLGSLARVGHPGTRDLIAAELKKDQTDNGAKAAISAEARLPDPAVKAEWMSKFNAPGKERAPVAKLREGMRALNLVGQEELVRAGSEGFFERIAYFAKNSTQEDEEYMGAYARFLYPALCEQATVDRTTAVLGQNPELPAYIIKSLRINRQEEERCVRARALSAK